MLIPRRFALERICGNDESRPMLDHIGVSSYDYTEKERDQLQQVYGQTFAQWVNAVAIATNGFAMVVVPCALDESDEIGRPGPGKSTPALHRTSFVEASKYWPRGGLELLSFALKHEVV